MNLEEAKELLERWSKTTMVIDKPIKGRLSMDQKTIMFGVDESERKQ